VLSRFLGQALKLFFLADVSAEGDDLGVVILFQPAEND